MNRSKNIIFIVLSAVAMIAVMITIFIFSGQEKGTSSEMSNSAGKIILHILGIEVPEGQSPDSVPIVFNFTIRNCAHIFLFFCMGITSYLFVASLCNYFCPEGIAKWEILITVIFSLMISVLYAGIDEFHQLFVDGRSSSIRDVGIDTIGISIALVLSMIVHFVVAKLIKANDV